MGVLRAAHLAAGAHRDVRRFRDSAGLRRELPHSFGHIPFEVWWFGAFGGCLVSFGGIIRHNREWASHLNYWHPVKPLLGAATGGIGCVLLLATLRAASPSVRTTDPTLFDGAAFVFGYAEAAFRELVTELTNTLLRPGRAGDGGGGIPTKNAGVTNSAPPISPTLAPEPSAADAPADAAPRDGASAEE